MPTNDFYLRWRYPKFTGKKRAQLGVRLATLRQGANLDLQRTIRQFARDLGFRTLRGYLHPKHRRCPLSEVLFQELMHSLGPEKALVSNGRWKRRRTSEPGMPDYPLQ